MRAAKRGDEAPADEPGPDDEYDDAGFELYNGGDYEDEYRGDYEG